MAEAARDETKRTWPVEDHHCRCNGGRAPGVTPQLAVALVVGVAAVAEDLKCRRVSNWTTGGALLSGLACHAFARGWTGLGSAALGAGAGFAVFLIFYLLNGMGGGDVKLMAAFGALTGVGSVLEAALLAAAAGGILAACVLAWARLRRWMGAASRRPETIPYAPAIVAGAWLTLAAGL